MTDAETPALKAENEVREASAGPETLVLSPRDGETFFELLANPPSPNEYMKRAFERGKAMIAP
jgi:uncharacterized protein (DUF1778 family)